MSGEKIDPDGRDFIYVQLARILRARIESGEYPPGRRIPSMKEAIGEFGVGDHTYHKAVALLRDEGLIETVAHRGSFVRAADLQALVPGGAWWGALMRAHARISPVTRGSAGVHHRRLSCRSS